MECSVGLCFFALNPALSPQEREKTGLSPLLRERVRA